MNDLKERAKFYYSKKELIHVEIGARFYNGLIVGVYEDHIILCDRYLGDMPINFSEIKVLEKFKFKEVEK